MKIEIKKLSLYQCAYTLTRKDQSVERITLETKTYLIHDICHFSVEKNLKEEHGFWGLLSQGFRFEELFGKNNPRTERLRFIEQIVGPVQAVCSGHIPVTGFDQCMAHLDFKMPSEWIDACLAEINEIVEKWERLPVGQELTLHFDFEHAVQ